MKQIKTNEGTGSNTRDNKHEGETKTGRGEKIKVDLRSGSGRDSTPPSKAGTRRPRRLRVGAVKLTDQFWIQDEG